jgi:DNA-binding transcriptional regulator PaaX
MAMYPNQNTIQIHRNEVKDNYDKSNLYLKAYQSSLFQAMKTLSGATFKVYIYLLFNKNNYYLDFAPAHIAKEVGISTDSARDALRRLKENGYLFERPGKKNLYDFYEVQQEKKTEKPATTREELISQAVPGYDHRDILSSINRAREKEQQRRKSQLIDLDAFIANEEWD